MNVFSVRSNSKERRICRIELRRISANPFQPRRQFSEEELHSLAESIRRFGLLSPLLVRETTGGNYELIAGERRLRALKLLGASEAEAIITTAFDRDCALIGLIENLQREDLHFLDEAEACKRLLREHGLTQEELSATLSRSPSALANLLRLLRLGRSVKQCIREGKLSERHARSLLRLKDENQQLALARRAVQEQLSVRQLDALIDQQLQAKPAPNRPAGKIWDNRLVINALRDTVRQLKRIGIPASSRVENHEDSYDVIVTIRTMPKEQKEQEELSK